MTEFSSSKDGTFEVEVPPGRYLIEQSLDQMREGQGGVLHPVRVVVPKGGFVEVGLWYDNQLRLPC